MVCAITHKFDNTEEIDQFQNKIPKLQKLMQDEIGHLNISTIIKGCNLESLEKEIARFIWFN